METTDDIKKPEIKTTWVGGPPDFTSLEGQLAQERERTNKAVRKYKERVKLGLVKRRKKK